MPSNFSSVARALALFLVPSSIAAFVVLSARPLPFGPCCAAQALSMPPPVQQTPADPQTDKEQDFQARCKSEGVLKCVGWDNPSDFSPVGDGYADGLYPAADGTFQGHMDTSIKTSGVGSLRFTVRPKVVPNATGYWRANFGPLDHLIGFGPHSTLYLQFRLRLSPEMLRFKWDTVSDTGWKVFIAYGPIPGPSCTGAQFVQENTYQTNVATAYTSCGTPPLYSNNGNPPMLIEQGDYNCSYKHEGGYSSNHNCFTYPANTWVTEYWVVDIGDFGKPNTHFTAYIAAEGQPFKRFIDLPNFKFDSGAEAGDALQTILLQPYLSGASGTKNNPTAYVWFDELIVSTRPIATPKF
ncbi:MAG: hypothetical protein WA789_11040 [Candidatus Acidiferrum sp.]